VRDQAGDRPPRLPRRHRQELLLGKVDYLVRTPDFCRKHASRLGPATRQVVDTLLADRPLDRLRSVQAILRLEDTVGPERLEAACARAVYFGDVRYRRIK
jgi:hypothetical protein